MKSIAYLAFGFMPAANEPCEIWYRNWNCRIL